MLQNIAELVSSSTAHGNAAGRSPLRPAPVPRSKLVDADGAAAQPASRPSAKVQPRFSWPSSRQCLYKRFARRTALSAGESCVRRGSERLRTATLRAKCDRRESFWRERAGCTQWSRTRARVGRNSALEIRGDEGESALPGSAGKRGKAISPRLVRLVASSLSPAPVCTGQCCPACECMASTHTAPPPPPPRLLRGHDDDDDTALPPPPPALGDDRPPNSSNAHTGRARSRIDPAEEHRRRVQEYCGHLRLSRDDQPPAFELLVLVRALPYVCRLVRFGTMVELTLRPPTGLRRRAHRDQPLELPRQALRAQVDRRLHRPRGSAPSRVLCAVSRMLTRTLRPHAGGSTIGAVASLVERNPFAFEGFGLQIGVDAHELDWGSPPVTTAVEILGPEGMVGRGQGAGRGALGVGREGGGKAAARVWDLIRCVLAPWSLRERAVRGGPGTCAHSLTRRA